MTFHPKFKMAAAAILDFQFMWIWPFRRVDSAVFVFCAKCGLNICYSHWDRRTYASDLHLMTSRELTSGFDFWSRDHLRMTVMNLPIYFLQDIFIQSKVIDIFPKLKMAAAAILDFQFMWIWPFRRVDSAVFVFCTKFGSNICYSHWDRRTCEFGHSGVLIVRYLCSVPNLVQICVIFTEIDAHMFQTFIWWRHTN